MKSLLGVNAQTTKDSDDGLLHNMLLGAFDRSHSKIVFYKDSTWKSKSNSTLKKIIATLSQHLIDLEVKKGDCILIAGFSSWQWLASEIAVLSVGGIVVGVDPLLELDQFKEIKQQTQAKLLITNSMETTKKWQKEISDLQILDWEGDSKDLYLGNSVVTANATINGVRDQSSNDVATIIYTSGTTGKPKGIEYTHEQILIAVEAIAIRLPEISFTKERYISWLPLAHLFQRMLNYFSIAHGGELYFQEDPREIVSVLSEVKPSVMIGVPRFFEKFRDGILKKINESKPHVKLLFQYAMANAGEIAALNRSKRPITRSLVLKKKIFDRFVLNQIRNSFGANIKMWISGSAPLPEDVLSFFDSLGHPIFEAYGVSENIIPNTMNSFSDYRPLSVGKPMPYQKIVIASDGEILIKGPGVLKNYLKNMTTPLTVGGYYPTGDLGYFDEDGYLYIKGRKKDFIKTLNGHKVYPGHVEGILNSMPSIEQSFVYGTGRSHLVALIYPTTMEADQSKLRIRLQATLDQANKSLSRHEVIHDFYIMKDPFSVENKEVTLTMKLRRNIIEKNYQSVFNSLYLTTTEF